MAIIQAFYIVNTEKSSNGKNTGNERNLTIEKIQAMYDTINQLFSNETVVNLFERYPSSEKIN